MKKRILAGVLIIMAAVLVLSFKENSAPRAYRNAYDTQLQALSHRLETLNGFARTCDPVKDKDSLLALIAAARLEMKPFDFWSRYLEPVAYKKLNGPLPVEWETEVFEKFEKPYRREGAGLTLAAQYLDEPSPDRDSLARLIQSAIRTTNVYSADSITKNLTTYHHFFLCNRLYLLNLAAIYTTGFECPDTAQVIPELRTMLTGVGSIYTAYGESFPATPLSEAYLNLYHKTLEFAKAQPSAYSAFDHFVFLRDYVSPLYALNQQMILQYKVVSHSLVDYTLSKEATSIFDKRIYRGQDAKGIYHRIDDTAVLAQIDQLGKLLFYDPILSGNNERSCASCHKPTEFFTDTTTGTAAGFDHQGFLARNTPSLINADYNHLIMADGQHYTLQSQTRAVITNPLEMGGSEAEILQKVMSCKEYSKALKGLLTFTPEAPEVTFAHLSSAITYYYSKFSKATSPFDVAMNAHNSPGPAAARGFNLFMGKAACATCHFVPQFNGVKPPFVSSEFEVLGVPADLTYKTLGTDAGRYGVNPAAEMMNAFRTGSVRNAARTAPYMHNGVFKTLEEVVDFYDRGGGAGHGLAVKNQTLAADSLHLSTSEKADLITFIHSLTEQVPFEVAPVTLPHSKDKALNARRVGGIY